MRIPGRVRTSGMELPGIRTLKNIGVQPKPSHWYEWFRSFSYRNAGKVQCLTRFPILEGLSEIFPKFQGSINFDFAKMPFLSSNFLEISAKIFQKKISELRKIR